MLSIGKLSSASNTAVYYLEVIANGRDDYYLASGEAPGRWMGSAAEHVGLRGAVTPEDLGAMLDGLDPRSGEKLVRWRTVAGFDLTLSAPKSVSLLWALGGDEVATKVMAAHDVAVDAAVAYFEDEACVVRRGRGGVDHLGGAGFVAAAFRHRTSRESDPNLHTHLVTGNLTLGEDGKWSALHSAELYRHGRTAGFVYQSVLRHEIVGRLAVSFQPTKPGIGEVVGIPEKVRRTFSRRRAAIERSMAEQGIHSARGAQVATLDSRPAKTNPVAEADLRVDWARRAAEIGFGLAAVPQGRATEVVPDDAALGRVLTQQDATFDRRQVIRTVAETASQGLTYEQIRIRAEEFLRSLEAIEVAPERWTTPEMLALEADALDRAHRGRRTVPVARGLTLGAINDRPSITVEQAETVHRVTESDTPVAVVVGHAGTGKTFALDAARAAWQSAGLHPRGAALAARAAQELQSGSGIPSQTIASLLRSLDRGDDRLTDRDVLVVDESGMVGTRDLHRLVTATTDAGSKLVLVGDPRQLAEIEAGGLFALFARHLGAAELTENRRMRDPVQRDTAQALRDRQVDKVLLRLHRSGSLTTDDNADRLRSSMADDWFLERNDGKHVAMLALHRSDVTDLNDRARSLLKGHGQLGTQVFANDEIELCVGDRVLALRNDRHIGVCNGTRGTVVRRAGAAIEIATDDGQRLDVPSSYVDDGRLTHGYAMTIHKSQGMTCDVSLVLGDDSLYAEAGYTSMTRGRLRNHIYAVSAPDPNDPTIELRRALARSAAKQTALELGGRGL